MGITVYYKFARESQPEELMKRAEILATKMGFKIEERSWNNLLINPGENSEWIELHWHKAKTVKKREGWDLEKEQLKNFQIDNEMWYCGGFTKTHYAGPYVHVRVCEFLRFIAGFCENTEVYDEADYYEQGMTEKTEEHLKGYWDNYNKFLGKMSGTIKDMFGSENVIAGGDI